jgi:predicted regulator of Ras-like GTPase activity (Roadblock/LC7/MglB family)
VLNSYTELISERLRMLGSAHPQIEGLCLVNMEGEVLCLMIPDIYERARIAPMIAAALTLGERLTEEWGAGTPEMMYLQCENGAVIIQTGDDTVLAAMIRQSTRIDPVFRDMQRFTYALERELELA